ncbi:hypothetical protein Golax_010528, partial [Gossypium laxum]|nr:hypothetical protein [Gossypium laxum]
TLSNPPLPFSIQYVPPNSQPEHPLEFDILDLQYFLTVAYQGQENPELHNLATFLKWFYILNQWLDMITLTLEQPKGTPPSSVVIIFYKPQYFMQHGASTQLGAFPTTRHIAQRLIQILITTKYCKNISANLTEPFPQRYDHQEIY